MSEYKRLTTRLPDGRVAVKTAEYYEKPYDGTTLIYRLAEFEDKLEAGTLVELPCKVGDIVYCLIAQGTHGTVYTTGAAISRAVTKIIWDGRRFEIYSERSHIWSNDYNECNYYGYLGETVFLTREAAEARLKELEEKVNELYSNNCR